jgi:hypothetical protein
MRFDIMNLKRHFTRCSQNKEIYCISYSWYLGNFGLLMSLEINMHF